MSPEYFQVARWHDNLEEADPISKELLVVHLANVLVNTIGYGQAEPQHIDIEHVESARILKMPGELIAQAKSEVSEIMEKGALGLEK